MIIITDFCVFIISIDLCTQNNLPISTLRANVCPTEKGGNMDSIVYYEFIFRET